MTAAADRHLLLGFIALQNGLINQGQLVAAFQAWTLDNSKSLADHLQARGELDPDDRAAVEALVTRHIKRHGGDVEKSLAAVPAGKSTREGLARLGYPDIEGTLSHLVSGILSTEEGDSDATSSYSAGTATSGGQRFRVLRPHAQGGLGAVFVALDGELNREVALKQILDHHADNPSSRQRFLLEAEVTGGLEHPGIVPVYGLGSYDGGRPYYAMRFIRGESLKDAINRFQADEKLKKDPGRRSLELRKLLRRFTDVCNAIDYAHSRGVLHRDIKPLNIIVGKHGETFVVDWGLAKATGKSEPGAEERTLVPSSASGSAETLPGSALGTPAYMSPEQARGDLEHLGPMSDVYSLGGTLYCLLTGKPPQAGNDIGEVLRKAQRAEFTPPRQIDPAIEKPLEAICLKAMALKPEDRYASCRALAEDIERWMADEPVSAYREPWLSRLSRWGRRHRSLMVSAGAILATATAALAAGLVAVNDEKDRTELARQGEARQRQRAEVGEREARDQERTARAKEAEAQAVLDFVQAKILAAARPEGVEGGLGPEVTLRKALEAALPQVESTFRGQSVVEASVRSTLGVSFTYLGELKTAANQFEIARERLTTQLGRDHPATLGSSNNLAISYWDQGRYADAVKLHEETLALRKAKLAPDHPDTLKSMNNLAVSYQMLGRYAEALKLNEETLELMKAKRGHDHPDTLTTMNNVAAGYHSLGRYADAIKLEEQTLALLKAKLGPDHPETLRSMCNLAEIYQTSGRLAEALELQRETLVLRKAKLGPDHPDTLWSIGTVAGSLIDLDRPSEALPLIDDCLRRATGKLLDPRLVPGVFDMRLRSFAKKKDADGCRQTAEMWEKLARTDADSLYSASVFWSVTASLLPAGAQARDAQKAMDCVTKAVAAGYNTPRHLARIKQDPDLDPLRHRPDFRLLMMDLAMPAEPFIR
jgi:eukaryotic-like serine/threonine-protein kinase